MGLTDMPNGYASFGIPLTNGLPWGGGKVFWVRSTTGQDAPSNGNAPDNPFATIDYAVGRCVAGRGDTIYVLLGHTETVSAAGSLALDVADVYVYGVGRGTSRPIINLGTVDTASITVTAANITLENFYIDGTAVDSITNVINIAGQYFTLKGCHCLGGDAGGQVDDFILTGATTTATGFAIIGNLFDMGATTGPVAAIDIAGTPDNWLILGNTFRGTTSKAAINNETGNVATNGDISFNHIDQIHASGLAIDLNSACTGRIAYNTIWTPNVDPAGAGVVIDAGAMGSYENYATDTADTSGLLEPVVVT